MLFEDPAQFIYFFFSVLNFILLKLVFSSLLFLKQKILKVA